MVKISTISPKTTSTSASIQKKDLRHFWKLFLKRFIISILRSRLKAIETESHRHDSLSLPYHFIFYSLRVEILTRNFLNFRR